MQSNRSLPNHDRVKGWVLDVYPSAPGEFTVWVIAENGERLRFTDSFKPKIYVSGNEDSLERLASQFIYDRAVVSWDFVRRYADTTDSEQSKVLEVTLKDCRASPLFTQRVLKAGRYLQYHVFNCDLKHEQLYFYNRDVFPLAFVEVESEGSQLKYCLLDSAESVDYTVPPLRISKIDVEVAKQGKIAKITDPIDKMVVSQGDDKMIVDSGDEKDMLLRLARTVAQLDPDIIVTKGGDSYLFPYLVRRAVINGVLDELVLSRDEVPLVARNVRGRTFFSYGRTYYRAPMRRLYGRVHVDEKNTFILAECGLDGLYEIARTCRVSLHTAARSSIGSSMSSIQFYQAIKHDVLVPRNKSIPEAFKSTLELLVGDRGGFVYEPEVGVHDDVGEVDFASMYPTMMVNNNISAETVLCKCCPDSKLRIPELGYNICEKKVGIVPTALKPVIAKRLLYKKLKSETDDERLRMTYDNRQTALKWILVTCFGYLGYRNARFGTVDGHIGVCAFGRDAFLKASRMAEQKGFRVIHGIVDSLWLKKKGATDEEYHELCRQIAEETKIPLSFEGRYNWIVFLPSRMHPNVGVLNRYYGVMESGRIKVRGLEVRRRDTPQFVHDAQTRMLEVLAEAKNAKEFLEKIPEALKVLRGFREKLLAGDVSVWDLIITKHLSKDPKTYKQMVSQVIAAKQLMEEGVEVSAGKNVKFLFTSAENKRYDRRVMAEELIETNMSSDVKKYLLLLYASAANMLSPFGYSIKTIYDEVRGQRQTKLPARASLNS
ncbi:MAG TPA: DNA polymerase domain-containing protein [Candidatus Acidoferrales bacterium]|nr:DNA polymerase domain-containing protein [Candidatus Acidoferrales bacterium]